MGRYYLAAAAIVLGGGSLMFAGHTIIARDWDVRATPRPGMTPTITRGADRSSPRPAATFTGDGPWVMSALPACFDEVKSVTGLTVKIHDLPRAAVRIPAGTVLQWSTCRVEVRADEVLVTRGTDVLRVPARAALFHGVAGRLVLVWSKDGRTEVRTYARR
jgi:hypothetical protein